MIDNNLVNSIRGYIKQGYGQQQVIDYLVSFGFKPSDVRESFDYVVSHPLPVQEIQPELVQRVVGQRPPKESHKGLMIIIAAVMGIFMLGIGAAYFVITSPECGNGILEEGEDKQTCCADAGCLGEQICTSNVCIEPACGECQYLENHECKDYQCCDDTKCASKETCESNKCETLLCSYCEYAENHECLPYACCDDSGCYEGEVCEDHACKQGCGPCQYRVQGVCDDYQCCNDTDCASTERCNNHFCTILECTSDEKAQNHQCVAIDSCSSSSDCDDNNSQTLDICIANSYCVHTEAAECSSDSDCDDDDNTTEDQCVGSPKTCSNTKAECVDFGITCEPSEGECDGDMEEALDTDYCCIGTCNEKPDLSIYDMDETDRVLEVTIEGNDRVNESDSFKLYAFENGTRMNTVKGTNYYTIFGQNETVDYYFNFTLNISMNVTAYVDYDDDINEMNESNNNMTIEVDLS